MAASCVAHEDLKNDVLGEFEATAPSGFEELVKDEIKEKFGTEGTVIRGRVNFMLSKERARETLELRGADNLTVVLKHYRNFQFADTLDGIIQQFEDLVTDIDWSLGLEIWQMFSEFPHPIDPLPKDPKIIEELGLLASARKRKLQEEKEKREQQEAQEGQGDAENAEKNKDTKEAEPAAKKLRTDNPTIPRFRATCYRSGENDGGGMKEKHLFQSPQAACAFGGSINDHFGWVVDLKNFDIEVILNVEGDHVYITLALTKESLHKRNITHFGSMVLRPTIAYSMLRFCKPQAGDLIVDPMCGSGSIPIEASLAYRKCYHIAGEMHQESIERSKANIDALTERRKESNKSPVVVDAVHWDATNLPLRSNSVDIFITDLPFGKRSGNKMRNWVLYPRVLLELARVARLGTGKLCLLTMDRKCISKSLSELKGLWKQTNSLSWVNIGGLSAIVVLLQRTNKLVSEDPAANAKPSTKPSKKHNPRSDKADTQTETADKPDQMETSDQRQPEEKELE